MSYLIKLVIAIFFLFIRTSVSAQKNRVEQNSVKHKIQLITKTTKNENNYATRHFIIDKPDRIFTSIR